MQQNKPKPLPITKHKKQILRLLQQNQVLIITGATGSGKSTEVPLILKKYLQRRLQTKPRIAITQPRRIACSSLATYLSQKQKTELGQQIGYAFRFHNKSSNSTSLKFMTQGFLLRQNIHDKLFTLYNAIILDQVHERNLQLDILIALLYNCLQRRKNFKLILMSATIDVSKFVNFFKKITKVAAVDVPGRCYPVDVKYLSSKKKSQNTFEDLIDLILKTHYSTIKQQYLESKQQKQKLDNEQIISSILKKTLPHTFLVFLSGQQDIHQACHRIEQKNQIFQEFNFPKLSPIPCYASLPMNQLNQILNSQQQTVQNMYLTPDNKNECTIAIHHLLQQKDYVSREYLNLVRFKELDELGERFKEGQQRQCEILTRPLETVLLQLLQLGITEVDQLKFIDNPKLVQWVAAYKRLYSIKAVLADKSITKLGRLMAKLPLEPVYAYLMISVLQSRKILYNQVKSDVIKIIALANIGSGNGSIINVDEMRSSSSSSDQRARRQQQRVKFRRQAYICGRSDHITQLNFFNEFMKLGEEADQQLQQDTKNQLRQHKRANSKQKSFVKRLSLKIREISEAWNIYLQLKSIGESIMRDIEEQKDNSCETEEVKQQQQLCMQQQKLDKIKKEDLILQCLARGLPNNIAELSNVFSSSYIIQGIKDSMGVVHYTSVLRQAPKKPKYIVYGSIFAKDQLYLQNCSQISPEWKDSL